MFSLLAVAALVAAPTDRTVYVAEAMSDREWLMLTAALGASQHPGILLRESDATADGIRRFLKDFRPDHVVRMRAGFDVLTLWRTLFGKVDRVLIASGTNPTLAAQAALIASIERVPLWLADESSPECRKQGEAIVQASAEVTLLRDADHVARRIRERTKSSPTVVVVNPLDQAHLAIAPWVAHRHRAPIVFDINDLRTMPTVESVILLGDMRAIPPNRRPNPLDGKDEFIEADPLTPDGDEPFSFAVGRLFDPEPAGVLLTLARQTLLARVERPAALMASNPGGGLELLELCSRHSARELRLRGFDIVERFRGELTAVELRQRMQENELIIWEGHHNTLIKGWDMPSWGEPMRPSLVVLQSCLGLADEKVRPLFRRGAVGVVSTACRTYSASGGAFTLAYLDAILHDGRSNGAALRQAKNFLIAYGKLKEQRLPTGAKWGGANRRAAWAFALWGDPTLAMPLPEGDSPAVRWSVSGDTIAFKIPRESAEELRVGGYRANLAPNMRLAGLLTGEGTDRTPVPMVFGEVALPRVPDGVTPKLTSKLAARSWVHLWDGRRKVVYILAVPPPDSTEVRFRVEPF